MAYCYECGEQVAENDIYCPYCGISLSPPAIADDGEKDSQSKIIVAQQPNAAVIEENASVEDKTIQINEEFAPTLATGKAAGKANDYKVDDFSNEITVESLNRKIASNEFSASTTAGKSAEDEPFIFDKPNEGENSFKDKMQNADLSSSFEQPKDFSEIPPPQIIERLIPSVGHSEAVSDEIKNTENQDAQSGEIKTVEDVNLEPVFVSTEGEELEDEIGKIENSQTESSLMSYQEAEVKEVLSAEEPEKSADEIVSQIGEGSSPSQPDANNFQAKENFSSEGFCVKEKIETPEITATKEELIDLTPAENSAFVEQPIKMPDIKLPVEESCPPSRFDSVRIMEKTEKVEETPPVVENPIQETLNSVEVQTPGKSVGAGSFTQPNIGVNDTDSKNKTKLKPLDEGTVLNGRYEIVRKIGGGGMGAVYLASDKNLGGVLRAVKEMVQSYIEDVQQEKAVNDFKRESLLLTSLDHQSIPTIYDYFFDESEARFYLVMKYISGGDLANRLRSAPEGRIDETSVTQWAIQIADVLDYLHNRQPPIIYRDLKPANIMIDGNSGRVMLIDFGIARWVNKEEKGVTAVGTMGYAPPELFSGNVEARSDIYSLGSTLFHLLTGADPQSNPLLIFDFQKHPRPRQINPQLSDQMERILMRTVEYNADKRFANAAELRQALEEHLGNLKAGRVTYGVKKAPVSISLSDQPVFCGFCGQKIVATDMFCAFCGAKQPLAQQGVHSESYAPAPLTAQLLIIGTNELEQPAYRLEKENNLVGRRDPQSNIFPEVDLSKYDPQTKISRRHARIWREGSEFMVEDLGSSNGTFILPVVSDSVRLLPHQPQLLTNGDKLRLGDTTLHFVLG
ncbi:MAG: protein kinase [Acidobacteria bacterium]|jgi:serine/threonine-protein kinase|nr:protein kinase [Acidobacteriota bacterium]